MMGMAPSNQGADGNAGYQNSGGFPSTGPPQSNYGESSPPPSSGRRYSSNESKKRLFIVSQPDRISTSRLSDMFSKFGNFISVNYIPGEVTLGEIISYYYTVGIVLHLYFQFLFNNMVYMI